MDTKRLRGAPALVVQQLDARRVRISFLVLFLGVLLLFTHAAPAPASYVSSVTDAVGDATLSPGLGFDGEAYQDITTTSITRTDESFVFAMEVATAIPESPALRTPNGLLLWMWGMQTDPGVPSGYPLAPGLAGILEFWIHVVWDGNEFYAEVIDRRPTLEGGDPIVTSVPFVVNESTVMITAPRSLFDDPAGFRWGSSTWIWPTHLGSSGAHVVDRAPNGAAAIFDPS